MTSPNINVFILFGTVLGYVSVVLLGLDVTIVDDVDFDTIVQVRQDRPDRLFQRISDHVIN